MSEELALTSFPENSFDCGREDRDSESFNHTDRICCQDHTVTECRDGFKVWKHRYEKCESDQVYC
jgi:hypothetical protein